MKRAPSLPASILVLALLPAACGTPLNREVRYAGDVTPQGSCGGAAHGTLTRIGPDFEFTPTDGVLVLHGKVAADGGASGEYRTTGADKKPYVLTFTGTVTPDHVDGRYVTPTCAYRVSLSHVTPSFF